MEHRNPLMEIERQSGTFYYGREEGLAEGREEGRCLALSELTLALLADRSVPVDAASEARIRSCEALPQLQRWARRAAHVATIAELFETS